MRRLESVAVFCGSSVGSRAAYAEAAAQAGRVLAGRGLRLVYGGGNVGLMGIVSDACLAAGGTVTGVIPQALKDREVAHLGLPDLRVVASMHERKALMADLSDAFIALPGGFGTLDELFEILTWAQLGIHRKPVGLLNVEGYFDPLIAMADRAMEDGLLRPAHRALMLVDTEPAALLDRFGWHDAPDVSKWAERRER